jgi:hypothetical protein
MKTQNISRNNCIAVTNQYFIFVIPLIALLICSGLLHAQEVSEKYFIGIELNGILCGYSEVYVTQPGGADTPYLSIDQKTYISFSALGQDITQRQVFSYRIDPEDGNFIYHDSHTEQGDQEVSATMTVVNDSVFIEPEGEAVTSVFLPGNTLLPNTMFFPYLQADYGNGGLDSSTYRIFNVRNGRVEDFTYRKLGEEQIELNNKVYEAVILQEKDPGSGMLTTYWIDRESGLRLKMESMTHIRMYLTGPSVMERLSTGNWDDLIFVRTNEQIGDLRKISSMKVHADLDAFPGTGMEDLNVPGQIFEGSVSGNDLKGVFEVEHHTYRGEGAFVFGETHSFTGELQKYLQAEELIQSDAPEIKELSMKLTEGSKDFWEAACRLSSWVVENIEGSVTGGSALETLHRREGACGSQSMLLAALCRASGIPARVVWGCVYTPAYGGSFGHHGWNEIFVGEEGWVPLDATLHESDYLDSGHIRLGVLKTSATVINFREMRIMDYALR